MSADNYFLIRRDGVRFAVSMGFASDEGDPPIDEHDRRFDTSDEARTYAESEYTEYGVREEISPMPHDLPDPVGDAEVNQPARCPECGDRYVGDFDPDIGTHYTCLSCGHSAPCVSQSAPTTPAYFPVPPQNPRTVRATCVPAGEGQPLPWGEEGGAGMRVDDATIIAMQAVATRGLPSCGNGQHVWSDKIILDLLADRAEMVKKLSRLRDEAGRMKSPKRGWTISIEIGGDTRDEAVSLLKKYMGQLRDGQNECVTGGYSIGGWFKVEERPEMTHEKYTEAVEQWCDEHPNPPAPLPDRPGCDEAGSDAQTSGNRGV